MRIFSCGTLKVLYMHFGPFICSLELCCGLDMVFRDNMFASACGVTSGKNEAIRS
jgi:hypothetical protein